MITQKRLKELLHYNPDTGVFVWKKVTNCSISIGSEAGTFVNGYRCIGIDYKRYSSHRLAWLYEYGYFPENSLDHINRNPGDNRIENLREASNSCNMRNRGVNKNNKTGITGVSTMPHRKGWFSIIRTNGKNHYLGHSKDFTEAVAQRLAGEQRLDWPDCDSSSPAYKYMQEYVGKING